MSVNYFDKVSKEWDIMRKTYFPDAVREKSIKEAGITPGSIVADIGSGTGYLTESLAKLPIIVIAVDQSSEMLRIMRDKFTDNENIEYILSKSDQIPLPDNYVDVALANMYLHHVDDPAFVISELYRILKNGGRLIITDMDLHTYDFLVTEQHDRWKGFDREKVRMWYLKAGFKNITVNCLGETCQALSIYSKKIGDISIFIARGQKQKIH